MTRGSPLHMHETFDDDPVRQATALLARASDGREDNFLVMTTTDLVELVRAAGVDEETANSAVETAFREFNAPKLAHLDNTWGGHDRQ